MNCVISQSAGNRNRGRHFLKRRRHKAPTNDQKTTSYSKRASDDATLTMNSYERLATHLPTKVILVGRKPTSLGFEGDKMTFINSISNCPIVRMRRETDQEMDQEDSPDRGRKKNRRIPKKKKKATPPSSDTTDTTESSDQEN